MTQEELRAVADGYLKNRLSQDTAGYEQALVAVLLAISQDLSEISADQKRQYLQERFREPRTIEDE